MDKVFEDNGECPVSGILDRGRRERRQSGKREEIVNTKFKWAVFTQLSWRLLPLFLSLASSWKPMKSQ
jgi:hypothetical protein